MKIVLFILCNLMLSAHAGQFVQPNNMYPKVRLITNHGDIILELDRSRAPLTVNNFLGYVKRKTYDNTLFHRLEPEFVLQGGGYTVGYKAVDEQQPIVNESGNGLKNRQGTVSMARQNAPHTATSQFFFNLQDNPSLDPGSRWGYTVFGHISNGLDIVEKIRLQETHTSEQLGWPNVPVEPVIIKMAVIVPE